MTENKKLLSPIMGIGDNNKFHEEATRIFRAEYPDTPDDVLSEMIDEALEKWYEAYTYN